MNDSIDTTSDIILPPDAGEVVFKSLRTTKRIYVPQGTHLRSSGNIEADEGITCFGNLNVSKGRLVAAYLHVGGCIRINTSLLTFGGVKAGGNVTTASGRIRVGGFLEAGGSINTGSQDRDKLYIQAGLHIKSGGNIRAQGYIQAGSYISAKGYIACEDYISAGSYIEADNVNCADRIFVGMSSPTPQEIRAKILGGTVVNPHQPWENQL